MKKVGLLLSTLTFLTFTFSQQLIINEVSQGESGSEEYVEFVVIGSPICSGTVPGLDLRGTIIDDNNGYFFDGSNPGIASGAIKFADTIFWANVPQGTYIVLYNGAEKGPNIPDDDFSTTDGNCRLVIPVEPGNRLFLGQNVSPNSGPPADMTYPVASDPSWTFAGALWSTMGMRNAGDSFQIQNIPPSNPPFHSVSWGNNDQNTLIYFAGSASKNVFSFINATSDDWKLQANWVSDTIALVTFETPGVPNSPANDAWVATMNPGCRVNPLLSFTTSPSACPQSGGSATVTPTGVSTNYTYLWENGQVSATATNLTPDTYTVVVTDTTTGCIYTDSVTVIAAPPVVITTSSTDATCGNNDGTATVNISGGIGPFTILWDANAANQITPTATNLGSGSYLIGILDGTCAYSAIATVNDAGAAVLTLSTTGVTCLSNCSGTATVTAVGGTGTLNFLWDAAAASQTTAGISNLCAGTYVCEVTDANGCTSAIAATIDPATDMTVSTTFQNESCSGTCDGSLTFLVNNAQGATTAVLSDGINPPQTLSTSLVSGLCSGSYILTITEASGCQVFAPVNIGSDVLLDHSLSNDTLICLGESAQLVLQGSGISNILWSNAATNDTISVSPTTTSSFEVSFTQSGCSILLDAVVGVIDCTLPIDEQLILPNIITPNGDSINDFFIPVFMTTGIDVTSFTIFNRWGNIMYESDLDVIVWNGKTTSGDPANDGTYFYILNYKMAGQEEVTKHGFFQLVSNKL